MTLLKLQAHCERAGFHAEVDGDAMTAKIFNAHHSLIMTVKLS